jgi:hypothetical protein
MVRDILLGEVGKTEQLGLRQDRWVDNKYQIRVADSFCETNSRQTTLEINGDY